MSTLGAVDVYELARSAGLDHAQAVTATAIARAESGWRTDARGDVALETAKWGPSLGLWQVRSLKAESGTGGTRDPKRLTDPAFNARSMYAISGGGRSWSPWSTYVSGAYLAYRAGVEHAVSAGAGGVPAAPKGHEKVGGMAAQVTPNYDAGDASSSSDATPAGFGLLPDLGAVRTLVLTGVLVAGGLALVLAGAHASIKAAA